MWTNYVPDDSYNWSVRSLWNSSTKIFTIGWYNLKSFNGQDQSDEANFEIQLNFNNNSFKMVYGEFGSNFPSHQSSNIMIGFTNDLSCYSSGSMESAVENCEGKDYVQIFYQDDDANIGEVTSNDSFQNPQGVSQMFMIDSMHNKNFLGNQTKNGTGYCLWTGSACDLNSSSYQIDDDGMMISMDVISPPQKNIWESSDVVQSHRIGNSYEFMWMHLNKAPTSVTFNALKMLLELIMDQMI